MAFSDIATVGFAIRNIDKTTSGDLGRLPVAVGQTVNAIKAGAQFDNIFSKGTKKVITACDDLAKSDKVFNGISKSVKFVSNNINPLIVASSGLKVALAKKEDRKKVLIAETGCVAGMFLGEGWMKKHLPALLEKLPVSNKWKPVIKGLLFIGASIGASTIGQKIGEKVAKYWDKPLGKQEENPQLSNAMKVYEQMNLKA